MVWKMAIVYYILISSRTARCDLKKFADTEVDQKSKHWIKSTDDFKNFAGSTPHTKKIVKRLIPEKIDAINEPGVDYPTLTSIPPTSFNCRGLKGGYYADLDTNCQVFHICDNGRKISFLCPNGTIFQQSQLICDWWFKVDCQKSLKSDEFDSEEYVDEDNQVNVKHNYSMIHRQSNGNKGNLNEQIRLNSNPTHQTKSDSVFDPNEIYTPRNGRVNGQFSRTNNNEDYKNNTNIKSNDVKSAIRKSVYPYRPKNNNLQTSTDNPVTNENIGFITTKRPFTDEKISSQHYMNKQSQKYYTTPNEENYNKNKKSKKLNAKENYDKSIPVYTESTTFRKSSSNSMQEFQELAESAAFVSTRGQYLGNENKHNRINNQQNQYDNKVTFPARKENKPTLTNLKNITPASSNYKLRERHFHRPSSTTTSTNSDWNVEERTIGTYDPNTNIDYYTDNFRESTTPSIFEDNLTTFSAYTQNNDDNINVPRFEQSTLASTTTGNTNIYENVNQRPHNFQTTQSSTRQSKINLSSDLPKSSTPKTKDFRNLSLLNFMAGKSNLQDKSKERLLYDKKTLNSWQNSEKHNTSISQEKSDVPVISTYKGITSKKSGNPESIQKHNIFTSTFKPYVPFTKSYIHTAILPSTLKTSSYNANVVLNSTTAKPVIEINRNKLKTSNTSLLHRANNLNSTNNYQENEKQIQTLKPNLRKNDSTSHEITGTITRSEYSIPGTLYSLALYFSTTQDNPMNTDLPETSNHNNFNLSTDLKHLKENHSEAQLPTNILTQHTLNSYVELFNLNNAVENNITFNEYPEQIDNQKEDSYDDLELQQSRGPLDAVKDANNTKLREIAHLFSSALSAYFENPPAFKELLTKVRPTEPSFEEDENEIFMTNLPTSTVNYNFATREAEEVLDYSDDVAFNYYTTSLPLEVTYSNITPNFFTNDDENNNLPIESNENFSNNQNSEKIEENKNEINEYLKAVFQQENLKNDFSSTHTATLNTLTSLNRNTDKYTENSVFNEENNLEPISTTEKLNSNTPTLTTEPIIIRYYEETTKKPLTELFDIDNVTSQYTQLDDMLNRRNVNHGQVDDGLTSSAFFNSIPLSTNIQNNDDIINNHWTSSPKVTQLWETTVFVNPNHINQELASEITSETENILPDHTLSIATHSPISENRVRAISESPWKELSTINHNEQVSSTPWQQTTSTDDAPTAFSLLPTVYSTSDTITPMPTFTTRSSITTTLTTSISATNSLPHNAIFSYAKSNEKVSNDSNTTKIVSTRVEKMFQQLDSNSNELLTLMKQANRNATVRQFILLLINHCNAPMNKTMEEEKQYIVNALSKMPLKELTSEESHKLITGIKKLYIPMKHAKTFELDEIEKLRNDRNDQLFSNHSTLSNVLNATKPIKYTNEYNITDSKAIELFKSLYALAEKLH